MSIIRKEIENPCYCCNGKGFIIDNAKKIKCPTCKGSGIWKDSMCYYIDDKKKICFDSEDGK